MKLWVDVRAMSSKPSGIGNYIYNFLLELIKFNDLELSLITDVIESDEIIELFDKNIVIYQYGSKVKQSGHVFKYFSFVENSLLDIKPDIFWEPNQIIPIKFRKIKNIKIVVTVHDILPLTHKKYHKLMYIPYFKYFLKKTLKTCDGAIYISKETEVNIHDRFQLKTNILEHISYCIVNKIKNVLDTADDGYFLYIGNLEKRKGVDLLLDSFYLYRKKSGNKRLIIAGKLREKNIKDKIDLINKDFKNSIEYLGYINSETKNVLLQRCSCFVFPSKAEGFGIPPIEAMLYTKPVIVSDISIFKEILGESVNYFSMGNKIQSISNLTDTLLKYNSNFSEYNIVTQKYKGVILGKELYNYFKRFND